MKKRIIITATNDLCTDQRVQKVSLSLHKNGFEVLLIGRKLKNSLPFEAPYSHKRLKLLFSKGFPFYAEINLRLFFSLLFSKTDIFLANDTDTLLPAYWVSKIRHKKLAFDAHELFPEVPEVTDRKYVKKVWKSIENYIFPKLKNSYTVCQSIADYYHRKYGINMAAVRNVPYCKNTDEITPNNDFPGKKILLYQGAVNIGRGLEWVIDCMPLLNEDCILVIIGTGDKLEDLKEQAERLNLQNRVFFLGKMPPENLTAYTKSADIGLCLLENRGLSYYYSLPNRVFDFMQAGVPLLATNFPEIENIVRKYETGVLTDCHDPQSLKKAITKMLNQGKFAYSARLKELGSEFCWEKEEKVLLEVFQNLQ